jgi:cytochrome P450
MVIEADQGSGKVVDMTPWFHFTTFDIFGDLGFGESFDCLQNSRYHPWISLLFGSVKAASYVAAARFYPVIEAILLKCIPASLKKTADNHFQQIADKVNRRLNWELERPDIMSHVIKEKNDDEEDKAMPLTKGMTTEEIYCTFMILTTAGSETTATALTGTLNYLVSCPDKLGLIVREIRDTFNSRDEMTLDALRDLPYLNAVISEGLRLCPPIPWMLPRLVPPGGETVSGVRLPGGVSPSSITR